MPVNRITINAVFGKSLANETEVREFLRTVAEPIERPSNAGEFLVSQIGPVLTDLFFRPYTRKMWAMELEEMSPSVVKRIPIRFDDEDRYFPRDRFQILPKHGYSNIFLNIFSHPNINVSLNTKYVDCKRLRYDHCFNSMPIDEFFDFQKGELPYRSIKFHNETRHTAPPNRWSVTNFTDTGPFIRETDWHALPEHHIAKTERTSVTVEQPCDYKDNNFERYYPVKTADDRFGKLYLEYKQLSRGKSNITFIGRCGTYRYLDMHQVISQSMAGIRRFMRDQQQ